MIEYKIGDKFWNWKYLWWEKKKWWIKYLFCRCKCWKEKWLSIYSLIKWQSTQCASCAMRKHWESRTMFYKRWNNIIFRCYCKSNWSYKYYWARWITVCDERHNYEKFKEDMYDSYIDHCNKYWEKNTSLDRINVDGNYCKENCKWVTRKEQWNNKRNNNVIYIEWKKYSSISEAARAFWVSWSTVWRRMKSWNLTKESLDLHK